jgi:hypothetical protein
VGNREIDHGIRMITGRCPRPHTRAISHNPAQHRWLGHSRGLRLRHSTPARRFTKTPCQPCPAGILLERIVSKTTAFQRPKPPMTSRWATCALNRQAIPTEAATTRSLFHHRHPLTARIKATSTSLLTHNHTTLTSARSGWHRAIATTNSNKPHFHQHPHTIPIPQHQG